MQVIFAFLVFIRGLYVPMEFSIGIVQQALVELVTLAVFQGAVVAGAKGNVIHRVISFSIPQRRRAC